jgi:hypothetical protein
MTVNIYYTNLSMYYIQEPKNVWKEIVEEYKDQTFLQCPSIKDQYKNTFSIKSPFDYQLEWTGNNLKSNMYDQKFFDEYILPRDLNLGICSILFPSILLLPDKSVTMSTKQVTMGKGDLFKKTTLIEGTFNPHIHIRKIEAPIKFNDIGEINIKENDDLFHVKINTDEKVNFYYFTMNRELNEYLAAPINHNRNYTRKIKPLEWWYNVSKTRGHTKKALDYARKNCVK